MLFLASQIQKEHSMEHLLDLLRQHKTDLEQYPLALTSTAKSSTEHSLDSEDVFKATYFLILVLCYDSMFSLQGYVNSMSITFLKALEKN